MMNDLDVLLYNQIIIMRALSAIVAKLGAGERPLRELLDATEASELRQKAREKRIER